MNDIIRLDTGTYILAEILLLTVVGIFCINKFLIKKKSPFTLVMSYAVVGLLGSLLFYSLSQFKWYMFNESDINLEPLVYLTFLNFVMAFPFIFLKVDNLDKVDDVGLEEILKIITIVLFILSIAPFFESLKKCFSISYADLLNAYEEGASSSLITFYSNQVRNYLRLFIVPLLFYFIYKGDKTFVYLAGFCFATNIISSFVGGGRGIMVNDLNYVVICYVLFRNIISRDSLVRLKKYALYFMVFVVVFLSAITLARFGGDKSSKSINIDLLTSVSLYIGQGPVEFSKDMYPSTVRTQGDNSFSLVKTFLGLKTFKDNDERREYWERHQTIPNFIFYTLVGDIYSDLGGTNTVLFFISMSLVMIFYMKKVSNKRVFSIQNVMIISIYYEWITMGIMANCYKTYYSQYFIFVAFIIIIMFNLKQGKNICKF